MGLLDPPAYSRAQADATFAPGAVPTYITGSHPLGYDRRTNAYNLKPKHLRKTRARLAAARLGTGLCRINWNGTSLVAGEPATPFKDNAPAVRLRNSLAALGYAVAGTGLVLDRNGASGNDGRVSASGTWSLVGASGIFSTSTQDGAWKQFASDLTGTIAEVLIRDSGTGQVKVTIDGVDVETITGGGTNADIIKSYTGLSDATHTIRFTKVGTTAGPAIGGWGVRKTSGLLISSIGVGGSTSADWAFANTISPGRITIAYGPADLHIIDVITNDVLQSVAVATYKTNMQAEITEKVATGADVLLIADLPKGGTDDAAYRTALYELADTNDLPLLDLRDRWGTADLALTLGMMQNDKIHATALGYVDKAAAVHSLLAA